MVVQVEIVGITDIAERAGVKRDTVTKWIDRHEFPQSAGTVSGRPWWWWHEVRAWLIETGRKT